MPLCDYGCGQEANFQFKNGKWCCSKNISLCECVKNKIREKRKGTTLSKDHKQKISQTLKGRKASTKTRLKMSIARKGKKHPNYGKKFSIETKKRISESVTGEKNHNHWKTYYTDKNIPLYDTYAHQLITEEMPKRDIEDRNILSVICSLCKKRFIPDLNSVRNRVRSLKGTSDGECRLYCSEDCKNLCQVFNRSIWPKDFHPDISREVQPELRKMRFELDNYTCQKCGKHQTELEDELHCHHIEGIQWEPLESADLDKVITLCKLCHSEVHKIKGCNYNDMKCDKGNRIT